MAKLTSTPDTTEFSDLEIKQMLAWLASVARDESESRAKRKNVCVASLSMAELFESDSRNNQRINSVFIQFRNSERESGNHPA
jgi:predicted lipid-binding transport protein (Tim44 family)